MTATAKPVMYEYGHLQPLGLDILSRIQHATLSVVDNLVRHCSQRAELLRVHVHRAFAITLHVGR